MVENTILSIQGKCTPIHTHLNMHLNPVNAEF